MYTIYYLIIYECSWTNKKANSMLAQENLINFKLVQTKTSLCSSVVLKSTM